MTSGVGSGIVSGTRDKVRVSHVITFIVNIQHITQEQVHSSVIDTYDLVMFF